MKKKIFSNGEEYRLYTEYKIYFLSSNFDEKTKVSTVFVQSKLGIFKGVAKYNPEDENTKYVVSRFWGGMLAEKRAIRAALKEYRKKYKYIVEDYKNFYHQLLDNKSFDVYSLEARRIRKKIFLLEKEINRLNTIISSYDFNINSVSKFPPIKNSQKATFDKEKALKEMFKSFKDFDIRVDSKNPPTRGLRASILDSQETSKITKDNKSPINKK